MRERIDEFFAYCEKYRKDTQEDWNYIMNWISELTAKRPDAAEYVATKLSDLLRFHGHDYSPEDIKAYALAGWALVVRPKEDIEITLRICQKEWTEH